MTGTLVELKGDMFTSDAQGLAHGVNCHGVMGAGVAKIVRAKYPDIYAAYREQCRFDLLLPGMCWWWRDYSEGEKGQNKVIFNLASQDLPGADARKHWLRRSFHQMLIQAHGLKVERIAIPEIGCGIGGLDRSVFYEVIKDELSKLDLTNYNITVEVWTL